MTQVEILFPEESNELIHLNDNGTFNFSSSFERIYLDDIVCVLEIQGDFQNFPNKIPFTKFSIRLNSLKIFFQSDFFIFPMGESVQLSIRKISKFK